MKARCGDLLFPLFCQGKARVGFLFETIWQCCGAEEEAEEELPASLTELGGQLGSPAGNMSGYGKGQGYPLHPPGWTLPCVLVSGEELWLRAGLCH